ncbi:extracellularly ATP-gated cation channel [Desmophyllum pertusum]|uniref:Extracellularly ATP-gated cation channel n=1 Tax=Desmophyllum pertusum TaxID=174260 RepID=A0A9W9ZTR9_9CNID|nr:extracellularly ATP-gated cation channel [Desmophyllum pertusum]
MVSCGTICNGILTALLEYDTAKIVHIKSKKVGLINRLMQLVIIVYIIGYVIVYKKGYQEFQKPYSSVTTKVKGVSLTNLTNSSQELPLYGGVRVWDSSDFVVPPEEDSVVFVMTNMIISPNQTQSTCPEDPSFPGIKCKNDSDCQRLEPVSNGHGLKTGKCVKADRAPFDHVCEIYSWCPVEIDELPMPGFNLSENIPLLDAAKDFTLLIKNNVQFPKFGEALRNIKAENKSYLQNCHYDPDTDHLCPIFKLGKVVELANVDFEEIAYQGGVMAIVITWNCNFDSLSYFCEPRYSFRRLDDSKSPIAPGYNFRYANYFVQDNALHRTLIKAYGIRFMIMVYGEGGKFSAIPLFLNVGSGLALLGIATVLCDVVVLYVLQKKYFYREKKYLFVDDDDSDGQNNQQSRSRGLNSTGSMDRDATHYSPIYNNDDDSTEGTAQADQTPQR